MPGPGNNRNSLIILGILFLVILAVPELLIHRHPHFGVEKVPLFFPLLGFSAAVILILLAGLLRIVLGRKGDYYGR